MEAELPKRGRPLGSRNASKSPAPETVDEGSRAREAYVPEEEAEELTEEETRPKPRIKHLSGGEVHWFTGGALARETR